MANLIKTDDIESALIGAGVDPSSDEAIAIREAVRGGDSIEDAIEAFAPTPSALATQAAAPVVKGKGGKKGMEAAKPLEAPAMGFGNVEGARVAGQNVGQQAIGPVLSAYEGGVVEGVQGALEDSQARVAGFLGRTIADLDTSFDSIARIGG
jgi:ribosomal protein L12E/L44/L45/RPP1/RPP2